jgi:predicted phage terminase large subunit-like protein
LERERLRQLAKTSLISFTEFSYPRYETASLHRQIAEQLERVERGEIDRLMLLVPPRHGKSELASRRFPAFYLGLHPERHFISASASATLAEDFGRDVRNLIASPEYANVYETRLAEDSQAKGRWMTSEGGSYYACGVGSALMGRGAHVFLIDDPFGSASEARSQVERKAVHNWFHGTCYNRLEKGGAFIIINHRLHQDDLSGMLLAQQAAGGDQWTVVEMKALSDSGEALWPEKFDTAALLRIKANTPAQGWFALYQQEPIQETGTLFKDEWIIPHADEQPEWMTKYGASDTALTSNGGDWSVHVVIGIDAKGRMFLVDMWRAQTSPKVWVEAWCDMVKKHKPHYWAFEKTQITAAAGPYLATRALERQAFVAQELFPTKGDKAIRCASMRGRMELSGLHVKADAPYLKDLKGELLAFPHGRHDDIVDSIGLVGQLMDKFTPGKKPMLDIELKSSFNDYESKGPESLGIPSFLTM